MGQSSDNSFGSFSFDHELRLVRLAKRAAITAPAVMLVGPAGSGKSRLAEKLFEDLQKRGGCDRLADTQLHRLPLSAYLDESRRSLKQLLPSEASAFVIAEEVSSRTARRLFSEIKPWDLRVYDEDRHWDPVWKGESVQWVIATYDAMDFDGVVRILDGLESRFMFVPVPRATKLASTIKDGFKDHRTRSESQDTDRRMACPLGDKKWNMFNAAEKKLKAIYEADAALQPAVMLRGAQYVRNAITCYEPAEEENKDGNDELYVRNAVCESYLLSAGPRLARLDRAGIDRLEQRLVNKKALAPRDFTWIRALLPGFRWREVGPPPRQGG